jgi:hypothetical protein
MKRPANDLSLSPNKSQFQPSNTQQVVQGTADNGRVALTRNEDYEYIINAENPILGRLWRCARDLISEVFKYCDLETILAFRLGSKELGALIINCGHLAGKAMTVFGYESGMGMDQDKLTFGSIHKLIVFKLSHINILSLSIFVSQLNINEFRTILRVNGITELEKLLSLNNDRIREASIELEVGPQDLLSLMQNPKLKVHSIARDKLRLKLAIQEFNELHKLYQLFSDENSKFIEQVVELDLEQFTNNDDTDFNNKLLQNLAFFTELQQLLFENVEGEGNMDVSLMAPKSKVRSLSFRHISADISATLSLPELTMLHFGDIQEGILILRGHCPRLRILEIGKLYNASVIVDESFNNFQELSISEGNERSSVKLPRLLPNLEKITLSSSCKEIQMDQDTEIPALKTVIYLEIDEGKFTVPHLLRNAKMLFFENILAGTELIVPDSFSKVETISFGFIDGETSIELPKVMPELRMLCFKEVSVNMHFILGDSAESDEMGDQKEVVIKLPKEPAKLESFVIEVIHSDITVKLSGSLQFIDIRKIENNSTIILEELLIPFTINIYDIADNVTFEVSEICNGRMRFLEAVGSNVVLKCNNLVSVIPNKEASSEITGIIIQRD